MTTNWEDSHYKKIIRKIKNYDISTYPRDNYAKLKIKISKNLNIKKDCFHLTNGCDGAIKEFLLMNYSQNKKKEVLILGDTYGMYNLYLNAFNYKKNEVKYLTIDDKHNFCKLDKKKFEQLIVRSQIVIIVNPNHISNYDFSYKEISELLKKYPKKVFFIDEAYYGYGCFSSINLTKKFENIYVARSFSKQFGLASIRLGCLIANEKKIKAYHGIAQPYLTNIFSASIAEYFLDNYSLVKKKLNEAIKGRNYLKKIFEKEKDFAINSSDSMSLLIDLKSKNKMNYFSKKLELKKIYTKKIIFSTSSKNHYCIRITLGPIIMMKKFFMEFIAINHVYKKI